MNNFQPTGRTRHRHAIICRVIPKAVLVLQIEERGLETRSVAGQVETELVTRWRDALIEDGAELSLSVAEAL
jgi:hypothetical protein